MKDRRDIFAAAGCRLKLRKRALGAESSRSAHGKSPSKKVHGRSLCEKLQSARRRSLRKCVLETNLPTGALKSPCKGAHGKSPCEKSQRYINSDGVHGKAPQKSARNEPFQICPRKMSLPKSAREKNPRRSAQKSQMRRRARERTSGEEGKENHL